MKDAQILCLRPGIATGALTLPSGVGRRRGADMECAPMATATEACRTRRELQEGQICFVAYADWEKGPSPRGVQGPRLQIKLTGSYANIMARGSGSGVNTGLTRWDDLKESGHWCVTRVAGALFGYPQPGRSHPVASRRAERSPTRMEPRGQKLRKPRTVSESCGYSIPATGSHGASATGAMAMLPQMAWVQTMSGGSFDL
jgi:hypothetical protein